MVIQCKQCETTYNFDESALQSGQVEVRCVRCKNVFTIDSTATVTAPAAQPLPDATTTPATAPLMPEAELQPKAETEPEPLPEWDTDSDAFSFTPSNEFSFTDDPAAPPAVDETLATDEEPESPDFTFESLEPEPEVIETPATVAAPEAEEPAAEATEPEEEVQHTPKTKKRKTSKLMILLLLIILMIAGAYGYFFVTLGTTDVMKMIENIQQKLTPPTTSQQGEIRINTTQSYYIDNDIAGQLFVIQGVATNDFATAQSELCVKATLYQKKGAPLIHQNAYCGNIIAKEVLMSASVKDLTDQMTNPFGAALSNVNIGSGQSIPFMIVFSDLPEELNEFSVEPASSKAASN